LDFIVVVAVVLRRKDYRPPENHVTHPCRSNTPISGQGENLALYFANSAVNQ
jgi:hypothetical protein